jgi:UDP-N-acetylmuramoyl-tripeptide--D-alanyl-D-alanine ligase
LAEKKLYRWRDVLSLCRSGPGRFVLMRALNLKAWPLVYPLARYHRRLINPATRIIAVTGSAGKSTTVQTIASVLGEYPPMLHFNHASYLAVNLLRIKKGQKWVAMEVGISVPQVPMAQQADLVRPDVAVVTSIGREHNTSYKSLHGIREAKSYLLSGLGPDGVCVLNGDDENVVWMASKAPGKIIYFGYDKSNDIRAEDLELDWPQGTRFKLAAYGQTARVRVKLFGCHMIYSVLAAVAVALNEGLSFDRVVAGLENIEPIEGRMQPVVLPNGAILIRDDWKSPLDTVTPALNFLAQVPAGRRIVVMGNLAEVPNPSGPVYRDLGIQVGKAADRILYFGTAFKHFRSGARKAGLPTDLITNCHRDVKHTIEILRTELRPGDVVLLKGQGAQHLSRIALGLMGRRVECELINCNTHETLCSRCAKLETGWPPGRRRL